MEGTFYISNSIMLNERGITPSTLNKRKTQGIHQRKETHGPISKAMFLKHPEKLSPSWRLGKHLYFQPLSYRGSRVKLKALLGSQNKSSKPGFEVRETLLKTRTRQGWNRPQRPTKLRTEVGERRCTQAPN